VLTLMAGAKLRCLAVLALAVMLVLVLSACGSARPSPSAKGPLAGASSGGFECGPVRPGAAFTFGVENFQNTGSSTLVLDSVALRDPRGILRIPIESDHLFRSNPIADSGVSDHLAGVGVS
jgi:hypothetical protein